MAMLVDLGPLPEPAPEADEKLATFEDLLEEFVCFREQVTKQLKSIEATMFDIRLFLDNARGIFDAEIYR
ncbi:MAG TPA: hypothetical protein VH157_06935 [Bryobacteraceae bacterium]|jgi:hypothetical protein|nr:hypothetical protein [Bryobacteraceae bacterium]